MPDETIVRLKITSSSRTPEQITDIIGIPCDKSWRVGDRRANTVIEEKNNGWVLDSGLSKLTALDAHVEALLKRLSPQVDDIRRLSTQATVEFSCVIYAKSPPALNFPNSVICQIGQLGASLDIDLYVLD